MAKDIRRKKQERPTVKLINIDAKELEEITAELRHFQRLEEKGDLLPHHRLKRKHLLDKMHRINRSREQNGLKPLDLMLNARTDIEPPSPMDPCPYEEGVPGLPKYRLVKKV